MMLFHQRSWIWASVLLLVPLCSASVALGESSGPVAGASPEIALVAVKGGCFHMGDLFATGGLDEGPAHEVCVRGFSIGKFPVTQQQWTQVMGSNPSQRQGAADLPVEHVSWDETQAFVKLLRQKTGRRWRLPTEAEWEYAAVGGKKQKYPGTSSDTEIEEYAWLESNSGLSTHPVGTRKPNDLGIYDMAGNVWQWVQDRYDRDYYRQSPRQDPKGDPFGVNRILKGGSAYRSANFLRASYRDYQDPGNRGNCVGFRLALSDD
jgi:formylglycine-generating enzyme